MAVLNYTLALISLLVLSCSGAPEVDAIPDQYVVTMTAGMEDALFDNAMNLVQTALGPNGQLGYTYNFADFRGFSFEAPPAVADAIRQIPGIDLLHPNYNHHVASQNNQETDFDPTGFALDRISHRQNANQARRSPPVFVYDQPAGLYTTIYVVDTGIHINHADFGGRAYKGANYAPDNVLAGHPPRSDEDYNGHGTSVAGLAAGFRYGAAKRALVVDVRIFNDNGSTSYADEIAGIDWAVNDASRRNTIRSSVMNLSFGGFDVGTADALSSAVRSAVNSGLFTTVASGNDRINAAYFTPANVAEACTIGGTDANDNEYYYSNYGNLVDLWAPGSNITAPAATSDFAVKQVYGTSFAAPLVAGVAAIFKSYGTEYTNYSPQEFCTYLGQTIGTKGVLTFQSYGGDFPGPNILLYDGSGA